MKKLLKNFSFIGVTIIFFAMILSACSGPKDAFLNSQYIEKGKKAEVFIPMYRMKMTMSDVAIYFFSNQINKIRDEYGSEEDKYGDDQFISEDKIQWKFLGKLEDGARVYKLTLKGDKDFPSITIRLRKNGDFMTLQRNEMEFQDYEGAIYTFDEASPEFIIAPE